MIITKRVKIKINSYNMKHFLYHGYKVKKKDEIEVDVGQLLRYSEVIVHVKCDICGERKDMKYSHYNQNCDRNNNLFCCSKCSKIRIIKTNLKKYGVENVSQSAIIKERKKKTNLKNWGTENVFQSEEIKEISRLTKKEKYGDEHFTNRKKSKETCFMNNGVEWPTQSKDVLKTRIKNNRNKYGVDDYSQTTECKNKIRNTCLQKYGVDSYLKTSEKQLKSRKTCKEKYGVEYPSQNYEIHKKQFPKMKIHDCGIKYQGSYEKDFLDLCCKNNLKVVRGKTIKFIHDDIEKYYFSDYYLEDYNLIVDIKSLYIFELHKELNLVKQESVLSQGYNFLFIIDKKYDEFLSIVN